MTVYMLVFTGMLKKEAEKRLSIQEIRRHSYVCVCVEGGGMRQWRMCVCGGRGYEAVEDVCVDGGRGDMRQWRMCVCGGRGYEAVEDVCVDGGGMRQWRMCVWTEGEGI